MCLILFAHDAHPRYRLVLAANRDEFHGRPAAAAGWWDDAPWVLGGRDLQGGGSWLGVTRGGRWAAVTNVREAGRERSGAPSRGHLVGDFLRGAEGAAAYAERVARGAAEFNGFNLLVGDAEGVHWLSNRGPGPRRLEPGVYGVSNHLLDTDWPKVRRGKRALAELLGSPELEPDSLLELLMDRAVAADHELPDTGVGLRMERLLSAPFIALPEYGTRASTALLVERAGNAHLAERAFAAPPAPWSERRYRFPLRTAEQPAQEEP